MREAHHILSKLNAHLGGSISRLEGDRIMLSQNDKGMCKALSVVLGDGISYTEFNLQLEDRLNIEMGTVPKDALYFIYVIEGEIRYSWSTEKTRKVDIEELQTVILRDARSTLNFHVPGFREKVSFAVIKVETNDVTDSVPSDGIALNQRLFEVFHDLGSAETFKYHGSFNLRIREQLRQIWEIKETGLVRKLLIKGIIHFTLALELRHHQSDIHTHRPTDKLTKSELVRVGEALNSIAARPEYPYSVSYLCQQYGLTNFKLQEGFKVLTGLTVSHYVKEKRIMLAERLIAKGDLNISEVVYSVGLTSRSYFSKIFKKKYNCSPKYYQDHCRSHIAKQAEEK